MLKWQQMNLVNLALLTSCYGRNRKCRRIVISPDIHPGFVVPHVVDAIRNRFSHRVLRKIMHPCGLRCVLWLPLTPSVLKLTKEFFLFGIDRDHGLVALQEILRCCIDVFKLRITRVGCDTPLRLLRTDCRL